MFLAYLYLSCNIYIYILHDVMYKSFYLLLVIVSLQWFRSMMSNTECRDLNVSFFSIQFLRI